MIKTLGEQHTMPDINDLSVDERLGLMVDREDAWGWAPFTTAQRRDMLELLDDRYGQRSTLVTSQMPVAKWHALIGDPTLGDAILDRLVHNTYRIELKGESVRRRSTKLTMAGASD
ncbi:ATP-binding protein [Pseudomonas sp. Fl5BN2]|uniref:ATP-binding protein n=1 Tax=unclassified Pseudomonas TaxID=196821 RepID=UPI00137835C0|nr:MULTISPECIES: ATP-binding protein [unclassified Pseudomonas]NBF05970.1 ATP-binding protein [Pseudomonas sp. Fl5BN2]NBF10860.1 ATP-binding protein [Pseudomonas sp. Fl4BN1]